MGSLDFEKETENEENADIFSTTVRRFRSNDIFGVAFGMPQRI
jgi:hypothetical protein